MINVELLQQKFNEYCQEYDLKNERIKLKIAHMIRVKQINTMFAQNLGLNQEQINLATAIGLLHDIGRFVQVKQYNTFIDALSVNHSEAGADLLFKDRLIERLIPERSYDVIIEKAIRNHGRFEIEEGLDEETLLQCQLIRDADKTDIFKVMILEEPSVVFDCDKSPDNKINPQVLEEFYQHHLIKSEDRKSVFDDYIRKVALIYNYYFPHNLSYVKEHHYIEKMTERFLQSFPNNYPETEKIIREVEKYAIEYINNKLEEVDKN